MTDWNDPVIIQKLISGVKAKNSMTQMMLELGATSRSAVSGAISRLRAKGLLSKPLPQIKRPKPPASPKPTMPNGKVVLNFTQVDITEPATLKAFNLQRKGVSIIALKRCQCKWPVREKPYRFCADKTDGSSYCNFHAAWGRK